MLQAECRAAALSRCVVLLHRMQWDSKLSAGALTAAHWSNKTREKPLSAIHRLPHRVRYIIQLSTVPPWNNHWASACSLTPSLQLFLSTDCKGPSPICARGFALKSEILYKISFVSVWKREGQHPRKKNGKGTPSCTAWSAFYTLFFSKALISFEFIDFSPCFKINQRYF